MTLPIAVTQSLLADYASLLQQANRILRLRFAANSGIAEDTLTPESLKGSEQLSRCYRYVLTCVSPDAALELKYFNGLPAEIAIELPDSSERTITGLVTSSRQLESDGGAARYQLTIEPALALLRERRAARVFQDQSVMQIIGQILDEHRAANPIFQQSFSWQADLSKEYPSRSYCIQYRESDLAFIQRLAAEEGISYRFQYSSGDNPLHTVIFFDDPLSLPQNPQANLRFGHAQPGLDKNPGEDVVKEWNGNRQLVPGLTSLASYDYKPVVTQHTQAKSRIDAGDAGADAQASLESYDPQTQYYGADNDEVQRYAALRQDAKDAQAKHFSAQSQVRDLHLGHWFTLDNHPVHDQDLAREREFLVTGFKLEAHNNLGSGEQGAGSGNSQTTSPLTASRSPLTQDTPYTNNFTAVRRGIPLHPEPITKPTAPGMQTATVVGPAGEEIHTDEHGRIKLQFHWQRPQDHPQGTAQFDDKSSTWVRVAHSSAGANWGSQFIPRIGQEVLVDFIEGDIDRPVVVGLAHNGRNMPATFSGAGTLPANKTLSGIKSKEYKGNLYNELLFDDSTNETRAKLSSEHAKTQLNQGYLIHPRTEGKGEPRGEGFELRTDAAGAIRSAKGLIISTDARRSATGKQLDRQELTSNLQAAHELANTLGEHAAHQLANLPETGKNNQTISADKTPGSQSKSGHQHHLIEALESLEKGTNTDPNKSSSPSQGEGRGEGQNNQPGGQPLIGISAPSGIAIATPNSATIATGTNFDQVSQRDTNQTTGRRWIHNVGESISLFVSGTKATLKETLKLIAAKGKIMVQAQSGEIEATADQAIKITSVSASQFWAAKADITCVCGGAYVKISGGNIEIHAPGTVSIKGASVPVSGPASIGVTMPTMPNIEPAQMNNGATDQFVIFADEDGHVLKNRPYRIWMKNGELVAGVTDVNGATKLLKAEAEKIVDLQIVKRVV